MLGQSILHPLHLILRGTHNVHSLDSFCKLEVQIDLCGYGVVNSELVALIESTQRGDTMCAAVSIPVVSAVFEML